MKHLSLTHLSSLMLLLLLVSLALASLVTTAPSANEEEEGKAHGIFHGKKREPTEIETLDTPPAP